MLKYIKSSQVKKLLPKRRSSSHKGENGKVLIVGGSLDYYGAPVLAGLGALFSGADLVYLYVPECNFECTRSLYPDFVVKKYPGEYLTERYAANIVEFGKKCDSVLIGPGLSDNEKTVPGVKEIVQNLNIPTVLDADAIPVLKKIKKFPLKQPVLITPHLNDFKHLVDREIKISESDTKSIILLRSISMDLNISVLLKGVKDFISSDEGHVEVNTTGNAGMTVGGSGDVLAGLVAGLISQGLDNFSAGKCAAYYMGKTGDKLKKEKGYNFSASDLAFMLPQILK